jgi:hypothetical protein
MAALGACVGIVDGVVAGGSGLDVLRAGGLVSAAVGLFGLASGLAALALGLVLPGRNDARLRRARMVLGGPMMVLYLFACLSAAEYLGAHYRDPVLMRMVLAVFCGVLAVASIVFGYAASGRARAWLETPKAVSWLELIGSTKRRPRVISMALGVALLLLSLGASAATFAGKKSTGAASPIAGRAAAWMDSATDFDGDGSGSLSTPRDCRPFDRSIHPGAKDVRANGIDEDCNGRDRPSRRGKGKGKGKGKKKRSEKGKGKSRSSGPR